MRVDSNKYRMFDYENNITSKDKFNLGDVVLKHDGEVGVIIQVHSPEEFRTDQFGNCSSSEIVIAPENLARQYIYPNLDITYTEKLKALYEEARIEIVAAVEKQDAVIPLNTENQFILPDNESLAVGLSQDSIIDKNGRSCSYAHIGYDELMTLADYVKAL